VLALDSPVAAALADLGLTVDGIRDQLVRGDEQRKGQIPFEPEAKRALEISLRESSKLGHSVIAPMHIALGIAGTSAGRGAAILHEAEADQAKLRKCLLGPSGAPPFAPSGFPLPAPLDTSFRVVVLEGDAADWESQLNDAASLGYDLVEIVDRRAIFRRE
jgi:hypothetical protein